MTETTLWLLCPLCHETHKLPVQVTMHAGDHLRQYAVCAKTDRGFWKVTEHPTAPAHIRRVYVEVDL